MEFSSLAVSVLATTGLFLGPIFLSVGIILLIKRRLRSHWVSPLAADLLRPAGHTLQQQIQDLQIDLFSQMLFTPLTMMMIGFYLLLQSYIDKRTMSTTVMLTSGVVMLGCVLKMLVFCPLIVPVSNEGRKPA